MSVTIAGIEFKRVSYDSNAASYTPAAFLQALRGESLATLWS